MRDKLVDGLLLITLIAVAVLIVFTLFSPSSLKFDFGRTNSTAKANGKNQNQSSSDPTTIIIPVIPGSIVGESTTAEGNVIIPVLPSERTDTAPSGETTLSDSSEVAVIEEPPEEPRLVAVAEGSLDLNRIGFSFVTGGTGACSIILEPWRHIAVSRDILATYPCGSEVTITLDETIAGRSSFRALVADTMNPVHSKTVNIYVGQDEPALSYGVRAGILEP